MLAFAAGWEKKITDIALSRAEAFLCCSHLYLLFFLHTMGSWIAKKNSPCLQEQKLAGKAT